MFDKTLYVLGLLFVLGGVAAACTFWAGIDEGGPIAFLLAGSALAVLMPVIIDRVANWGVPGDEPALSWRSRH